MTSVVPLRRVWPWIIALYKFLRQHLRPILDPNVFASLFRRFVFVFKLVRSKCQIWYGKQRYSKPPSSNSGTSDGVESGDQEYEHLKEANVDHTVVSLDNISCSLYPYGTGLRDSSRSSRILNASRSSHNLGIVSRSQNASWSSHNAGSSAQSPLGGGYTLTIQPTSPRRTYSMSSPELGRPQYRAADLHDDIMQRRRISQIFPQPRSDSPVDITQHRRISQIFPQPRSDSPVGSIELLSPGEISSSRDRIPPASSIEQPAELPRDGTSSQTHTDDLEIPALNHHRIYPAVPELLQRYEKRRRIPKKATRVNIKPMVMDFSDCLDPPGWTLCTHPEGAFYFYNAEKRIFTDVDLYDSASRRRINLHIEIIEDFIYSNHISIPERADLVLDINLDAEGTYVIDYYFANHQDRIIFFLDHFSTDSIPNWGEIEGVSSGRHLRHEMEAQYWWHCLSYPSTFQLTDDLVCELRAIVMHYIGDCLTSPYANSPYTVDELYKILTLIDSMKENVGKPYDGCTSLLSSADTCTYSITSDFSTFMDSRKHVLIVINQFTVHGPTDEHDVHLKILQKMWVDLMLHKAVWQASLKKANEEWREFILYATVLLNANVAFLGTPRAGTLLAAQTASYFSISTSVGSIVLGLLLVRLNQKTDREAADVIDFLRNRSHPLLGLETLAIMFSLPYALLMWSMVSFLVAFLLLCFQDSSTVTISLIGSLGAVITVLVLWLIWTSWEKHPASDAQPSEKSLSFEDNDDSEERSKKFTFEVIMPEPTEASRFSVLGLRLPLPFEWPSFLHRRRQSYDSNGTVVNP